VRDAQQHAVQPDRRCLPLHPGDRFPALTVSVAGGRTLRLPDDLAGHFAVVLFYRGVLVPVLQRPAERVPAALDGLTQVDATLVALSVDDGAAKQELIAKHGLRFPIGYGADALAIADATGAFVNEDPLFIQSTGLVLDPTARSSSARTPAALSGDWSPRTSSASSATSANSA
jgi:peroxiredoxin